MDKILITGGAGFIGLHLSQALLAAGYTVVSVDYFYGKFDPSSKWPSLQWLCDHPRYTLLIEDIRNQPQMQHIIEQHQIQLVIHLAALAGVRPSLEDPFSYVDHNINGTLSMLESMRKTGVSKMLFASSSSVYGNSTSVPFREDDLAASPVSPYAFTKRAAELLCSNYHSLYGIDCFCLRFFTVYGPGQRPEMAINKFLTATIDGKVLTLFGDGQSARDYTYVTDITSGILAAIPALEGFDIFNLGSGRIVSLENLIQIIERVTGRTALVERLSEQMGDVPLTFASIHKAFSRFGYRPETSLEEGISKMYQNLVTQRESGRLTC